MYDLGVVAAAAFLDHVAPPADEHEDQADEARNERPESALRDEPQALHVAGRA